MNRELKNFLILLGIFVGCWAIFIGTIVGVGYAFRLLWGWLGG